MLLVKILEIIVLILVVIFSTIFSLIGIVMAITKSAIDIMMEFKGDKKDEQ